MKNTIINNAFQNSTASDAGAYTSSIFADFPSTSSGVPSIFPVPFFDIPFDRYIPTTVLGLDSSLKARKSTTGRTSGNARRAPRQNTIPSCRSALKSSRPTTASRAIKNFAAPRPSTSSTFDSTFKPPRSSIVPGSRRALKPPRDATVPRFVKNSEPSRVSTSSAVKDLPSIVSNSIYFSPIFASTFGTAEPSALPYFDINSGTGTIEPSTASIPHSPLRDSGSSTENSFGSTSGAAGLNPLPYFDINFSTRTTEPSTAPIPHSTFRASGPSIENSFSSTSGAAGPSTLPYFDINFGTRTTGPSTAPFPPSTLGAYGSSTEPSFGSTFGASRPSTLPYFDINSGTGITGPSTGTTFTLATPSVMNLFSTRGTTSNLYGTNTTTCVPSFFRTPTTLDLFVTSPLSVSTLRFAAGGYAPSANLASTINASGFFKEFQSLSSRLTEFRMQELKNQQVLASISSVNIYGDERDSVLKKWNMLQACRGLGKGYYSNTKPHVDYDHTNQFYRFKAISYEAIPRSESSDGFVKLYFCKKESELSSQKEVLTKVLVELLGNRSDYIVNIHEIRPTAVEESHVLISVAEKRTNRKMDAIDLANYLREPFRKQRLDYLGVLYIYAHVGPAETEIQKYLKVPPPGIDFRTWQEAQFNNPQPDKYLPLPVFGFLGLANRTVCQNYTVGLHREHLDKISKKITEVKKKYTFSLKVIAECKYKLLELQHKVVKVICFL